GSGNTGDRSPELPAVDGPESLLRRLQLVRPAAEAAARNSRIEKAPCRGIGGNPKERVFAGENIPDGVLPGLSHDARIRIAIFAPARRLCRDQRLLPRSRGHPAGNESGRESWLLAHH